MLVGAVVSVVLGVGSFACSWYSLSPASAPAGFLVALVAGASSACWRAPRWSLGLAMAAMGVTSLPVAAAGPGPDSDEWNVVMSFVTVVSLGAFARPLLTVAGVVALAFWISVRDTPVGLDWIWPLLPFTGIALVAHLVAAAGRSADMEQRRTAALEAVSPAAAARAAVAVERTRLLTDVHAAVRAAVESMTAQAEEARSGPRDLVAEHLRRVQREGQTAIAELRGLLGLLRTDPDEMPASAADQRQEMPGHLPHWVDATVLGLMIVTAMFELFAWREGLDPALPEPGPLVVASTVAAVGTVALRRDNPGLGAAVLGTLLVSAATGAIPVGVGLTMIVVIVTLTWSGVARRDWSSFAGVAVLVAGTSAYLLRVSNENAPLGVTIVLGTAAASFVAARSRALAAAKSSRADELAAERQAAALRAVQAQRLSLARELHDLVSNAVVVMTVQAGAAKAQLPIDAGASNRAVDHILETGRTTLAEVDQMFAALGDESRRIRGDELPQDPARHDIRALVDRMRAGGLDVELVSSGPTLPRCPVTFRVVQESLTNALRHAPASHVRLTLTATPSMVSVDVIDDGPGRSGASSRGYGLVGITERVERIGGRIDMGAGPGGRGFHVAARIPVQNPGAPT